MLEALLQWLRRIHLDLRLRGFNRGARSTRDLRRTALLRPMPDA